jgi:hypothetical protein
MTAASDDVITTSDVGARIVSAIVGGFWLASLSRSTQLIFKASNTVF